MLLIVNPNSSERVTRRIKGHIESISAVACDYYTAPATAPKIISNTETGLISAKACSRDLEVVGEEVQGILLACFIDHPLAGQLRGVVVGIFEAAVDEAVKYGGEEEEEFGVLTTTAEWEPLVGDALARYGVKGKVGSIGMDGLEFMECSQLVEEEVLRKGIKALQCKVVILGAIVFAGAKVNVPGVRVIDALTAGYERLVKEVADQGSHQASGRER